MTHPALASRPATAGHTARHASPLSAGRTRPAPRPPTRTRLATAAGLLVLAGLSATAAAQGRHETVLQTSQAIPGTAGQLFGDIGLFVDLTDAGHVAVGSVADSSGQGAGVFRYVNGTLTPIALGGRPAPGTSSGSFASFSFLSMNSLGQIGFNAGITGDPLSGGVYGSGGSFGSLAPIALAGPGAAITSFSAISALSNAGQVAVQAHVPDPAGGPDTQGLYLAGSGTWTPLAQIGQSAPGSGGSALLAIRSATVSASGAVTFEASTLNNGAFTEVLYRANAGSLTPIAREGEVAPGTGGARFSTLDNRAMNDAGQSLFSASLDRGTGSSEEGIFLSNASGSALTAVAVEGQSAPGAGGGSFANISTPALNQAGQVAFGTTIAGSSSDWGLFRSTPGGGSLTPIARAGQIAPDTGGGVFVATGSGAVRLNDRGLVSFQGAVGGGNTLAGLFLSDGRETVAAQRLGQQIDGRTVVSFGPFLFVTDIALNNHGQLAYYAVYEDGGNGVHLFTPDLRWRESFSGGWDTAEHWTLGIAPAAVHEVRIDPATALTVTGPAGAVDVRALTVGGGAGVATLRLAGGTLASANPVQVASNGVLTGQGTLNAELMNAGSVRAAAGQTLALVGAAHGNAGRIDVQGVLRVSGTLNNQEGAQIGLDGGRIELNDGLRNRGLLQVEAGGGQVFGPVDNLSGGRITVAGGGETVFHGALRAGPGAELRVASGATVQFLGPVEQATGSVFSGGGNKFYGGGLSVGDSPGFGRDAGNVRFGAGNVYLAEIGGTRACTLACAGNPALADQGFDKYVVDGTLILGGTLRLVSWAGMVAQEGDSFDLFDWGTLQGRFDSIDASGLTLAAGTLLDFSRLYTTGEVGVTAVPEPGTYALMLAGLLALGLRLNAARHSRALSPAHTTQH